MMDWFVIAIIEMRDMGKLDAGGPKCWWAKINLPIHCQ
jgi:hypothetical protein